MDTKIDALTDAITSGWKPDMCPSDPCALLQAIAEYECEKAETYEKLAKSAPTACLKQVIKQMAAGQADKVEALAAIAEAYGLPKPTCGPPPTKHPPCKPPKYYDAGEKKEE